MTVIDDDPVTPGALAGVFRDAQQVGRPVQVFALAPQPRSNGRLVDRATLEAIRALSARKDIEACTGSITVLMNGETAGVVVAQPLGAPVLKEVGEALAASVASALGRGSRISVGLATTREHTDLELDDAIAVAMEGLEVASQSGVGGVVHSELYELTLATRRRLGTVYPLEPVQDLEDMDASVFPDAEAVTAASLPVLDEAATTGDEVASAADASSGAALHEEDDPFAHLASDPYALGAESAALLVEGIAPQGVASTLAEEESRAEIERLKLELEVARRERNELDAADSGDEFERQERRITKLVDQLDVAESEIERLQRERDADPGVASTFKSVQGLDPSEANAPVKRVLIDGVFEANQKKADEGSAG